MATNGEKLKAARLKQGKSVQDIAQLTRISPAFLEAIEENQLDKIPGSFFRRSFLRQYAEVLGLNPDEFRPDESMEFRSLGGDAYGSEEGARLREPPDLPPLPPVGGRRPVPVRQVLLSTGLLIGVLALCAVAYTLWEDYQLGRDQQQVAISDPVPPLTEAESAIQQPEESGDTPADESTSSSGADVAGASTAPQEVAPAAAQPSAGASPSTQAADAAATPQQQTAARTTFGEGARELRLSASAPTWVEAREGDRVVYSGVIQPGQSRVVRVSEGARLVVGNAGGLSLAWQGETMEAVGPLGQVRIVNVSLDGVSVSAPVRRTEQSDRESNT